MARLLSVLLFFSLFACDRAPPAQQVDATPHGYGGADLGDIIPPSQTGVQNALLSSNPNFVIRARGYGAVTVYTNLTWAAASAVNLACSAGNDPNYLAQVGVASVGSSGAITMADASWTYPTGGRSRMFRVVVGPLNDNTFSCTVSGTGATTDRVNVALFGGSE